jgi:hypothetical protein
MKPIWKTIGAALCWLLISGGSGCSRQFPSSASLPYPLPLAMEAPIGSAYPGTRELMDAPSNDPALNNDRNGVELRP